MSKQQAMNPSDLDIMMFLDGELSGDEAKRVEVFLDNDEEANTKAACLGQMTELVRGSMELAADAAEEKLAGLWAGIESGIQSEKNLADVSGVSSEASAVEADIVPIGSAAIKAEERATQELVEKASWFGGWQSHIMTGAIVAAAVAVLMVATRSDKVEQATAARRITAPANQPITMPVVLKPQAPEIEKLEVYNGSGTIMMVGGPDDSSAVIWITNDTDVVEDPI
ncbi:MAG: hypothetical protein JKY56_22890 [Kofleriaceae bacterium]|nr:hypothetical protein [Kofleriaceae bacterium]